MTRWKVVVGPMVLCVILAVVHVCAKPDGEGDVWSFTVATRRPKPKPRPPSKVPWPAAAKGPSIEWSSYLGGSGYDDLGYAAAVDDSGYVFIAGRTTSSDYPLSVLSDTMYSGGEYDGFLAKIANSGELLWSMYLGGAAMTCVWM